MQVTTLRYWVDDPNRYRKVTSATVEHSSLVTLTTLGMLKDVSEKSVLKRLWNPASLAAVQFVKIDQDRYSSIRHRVPVGLRLLAKN